MTQPTNPPYPTPWRVAEESRSVGLFLIVDADGEVVLEDFDRHDLLNRIVAAVNREEK